ncbi:hypothetical protein KL86DPRO_11461 [uncultured delta proteobacterium]|uniref:Uncharacterized protein n=1 Tax=uncultured delta proteobacterium TaxID=34034 RepID=A0A212JHE7_9DELT|nr:hypothetical protein KL86DPRO_11461 [uncultured delta proteobacterium]
MRKPTTARHNPTVPIHEKNLPTPLNDTLKCIFARGFLGVFFRLRLAVALFLRVSWTREEFLTAPRADRDIRPIF